MKLPVTMRANEIICAGTGGRANGSDGGDGNDKGREAVRDMALVTASPFSQGPRFCKPPELPRDAGEKKSEVDITDG